MLECRDCWKKEHRKNCLGKQWYSPGMIKFCTNQVIWVLGWLPYIREGNWPPEPSGGYIESLVSKKSRSRRAPYEKPMEVSGELNARLTQCGKDRYIVEDRYTHGIYEEVIAQKLGMNVGDVYQQINSLLKYLSGKKRKRRSYKEWRGHR